LNVPDDNTQDTQNGSTGSSTSATTKNTDSEHMIPKSRFDEVNERARKAEEALAKIQRESESAEQARLLKQGEYQQLAEKAGARAAELEPFKGRAEEAEAVILQACEALVLQIPEDIRDSIVPDLPPAKKFAWLSVNVPRLLAKPAPNLNAGEGNGTGSGTKPIELTAEQRQMAVNMRMTPEQYAKRLQEITADKDKNS
jgi:ribonucleoside-triphosphate reductase